MSMPAPFEHPAVEAMFGEKPGHRADGVRVGDRAVRNNDWSSGGLRSIDAVEGDAPAIVHVDQMTRFVHVAAACLRRI